MPTPAPRRDPQGRDDRPSRPAANGTRGRHRAARPRIAASHATLMRPPSGGRRGGTPPPCDSGAAASGSRPPRHRCREGACEELPAARGPGRSTGSAGRAHPEPSPEERPVALAPGLRRASRAGSDVQRRHLVTPVVLDHEQATAGRHAPFSIEQHRHAQSAASGSGRPSRSNPSTGHGHLERPVGGARTLARAGPFAGHVTRAPRTSSWRARNPSPCAPRSSTRRPATGPSVARVRGIFSSTSTMRAGEPGGARRRGEGGVQDQFEGRIHVSAKSPEMGPGPTSYRRCRRPSRLQQPATTANDGAQRDELARPARPFDDWIGIEEAAAYLAIPVRTLYLHCPAGSAAGHQGGADVAVQAVPARRAPRGAPDGAAPAAPAVSAAPTLPASAQALRLAVPLPLPPASEQRQLDSWPSRADC